MGSSRPVDSSSAPRINGRVFVSVIIPAFNESSIIGTTVATLRRMPPIDEVIVVDDGSTDNTAQRARQAGARVVRLSQNRGKGIALTGGIGAAKGDVLVLLDADLGETASQAAQLLAPVLRNEADVAIGAFSQGEGPSGLGFVQTVAKVAVRQLGGLRMNSPLSGQRALTRDVLRFVQPFAARFGVEVAFTIDAARAGLRVVEVPVKMQHRKTRRDVAGFMHRGRQFFDVARALAPRLWTRSRL